LDRAVAEIVGRLGGISGLFANAGYGQFAPFLETTSRSWSKLIEMNLNGTFNVCQSVARVNGRGTPSRGRSGFDRQKQGAQWPKRE
jgi:NAD(P)-dependent dehydrogenase (short-subunit alcohol dehydrogenase family)